MTDTRQVTDAARQLHRELVGNECDCADVQKCESGEAILAALATAHAPMQAPLCPRCLKNPIGMAFLGTEAEGYHICGECWKNDRFRDGAPVQAATPLEISREWCLAAAERESDSEIGAGSLAQDPVQAADASLRTTIGILLANLRHLEEVTGEAIEGEDAQIVAEIEREHKARDCRKEEG